MTYAKNTSVGVEKSRAEIERTLTRYGADQFMFGWKAEAAVLAFRAKGRHIRFTLPMPLEKDFARDGRNSLRSPEQRRKAVEQANRERWRALCLCIKAKLEAVETGISEFEDEFLAHIVLPTGETMSEHSRPLIARAYETGKMPPLLGYTPS